MRKFMPVILAVIVGTTCAFMLFRSVEKATIVDTGGNAIAIQIGVFTKRENAEAMRDNYGGVVQEDEGLYRVYYSVLCRDDNINFVTEYLDSEGINYYLKKVTLTDEVLDKVDEYEELMEKTSNKSKMNVNEEILKMYKEVV